MLKRILMWLFVLFAMRTNTLGQSTSSDFTVLQHWSDTNCEAVYVQGTTAYFGADGFFEIVDFQDPKNPLELGRMVLPDTISAITVQEKTAYLGTRSGRFLIVDISDLASLRVIGSYTTSPYLVKTVLYGIGHNGIWAYLFYGDPYFRLRGVEGIIVLDVSNPAVPVAIDTSSIYLPGAQDFIFQYPYIYLNSSSALHVMEVASNPRKPARLDIYGVPITLRTFAIASEKAYLVTYDSLVVIDLSDPRHLRKIGGTKTGNIASSVSDLQIRENLAYLLTGTHLRVFDISSPDSIFNVGNYLILRSTINALAVSNEVAYIANYKEGLQLLDVSDPQNIKKIGGFNRGASFKKMVLQDNLIFAGFGSYGSEVPGGVLVLDFWSQTEPKFVSSYSGLAEPTGMVLRDNLLFIADNITGLQILDVSDPLRLRKIGFLPIARGLRSIAIYQNYVYLSMPGEGLAIIDVKDPAEPVQVGLVPAVNLYSTTLKDHFLYLAVSYDGLRVLDISNPAQPVQVGFYPDPNFLPASDLQGNFVYIVESGKGLTILDVSDPRQPVLAGSYGTTNLRGTLQIHVEGIYAYVGVNFEMWVFDISNKANPKIVATYNENDPIKDIASLINNIVVYGDTIYLVTVGSIFALENEALSVGVSQRSTPPSAFYLLQNYPNPFNPSTTIRYAVDKADRVQLNIYNLEGQLIRQLVNQLQPPGEYTAVWDGRDKSGQPVTSGIYSYFLTMGTRIENKRMLLIK